MKVRYNKAQADYAAQLLSIHNPGPWADYENLPINEFQQEISFSIILLLTSVARDFVKTRKSSDMHAVVRTSGYAIIMDVDLSCDAVDCTVLIDPYIMIFNNSVDHEQHCEVDV